MKKKVLAEIAKQHGIEWEQKGTHEEHLDVITSRRKSEKRKYRSWSRRKSI